MNILLTRARRWVPPVLIATIAVLTSQAAGAVTARLKIDGIQGPGPDGAIEVSSFSLSSALNCSGQICTPAPPVITVSKPLDVTSPKLALAVYAQTQFQSASLVMLGDNGMPIYRYRMASVGISSVTTSGQGEDAGGTPVEEVHLEFSRITWIAIAPGGNVSECWDFVTNKRCS